MSELVWYITTNDWKREYTQIEWTFCLSIDIGLQHYNDQPNNETSRNKFLIIEY